MNNNLAVLIPIILKTGVLCLLLNLVGCGAGGGNSTPTPATTPTITGTAEGVYTGTISNGNSFDGIVLENGTYYMLYGTSTAGVLYVSGIVTGSGTSNNGSFTSSNLKDYYHTGAVYTGSVSASYGLNNTFIGSVIDAGTTFTFTSTPPISSLYIYNVAANLANISGTWALTDLQGSSISMTIASNGTFNATSGGGCTFSGTLTPRASGKNIFNLSITFGAAPCSLAGQTASGIGIDYLLSNGLRQFIIAGTNSTQTAGTAAFGTR
jgi:hypothetical protein